MCQLHATQRTLTKNENVYTHTVMFLKLEITQHSNESDISSLG